MRGSSVIVFDSFGVLEHVLSFASPKDLVHATEVNQRWREAGRSDILWKLACASFWKDRKGVPKTTVMEDEIPLFWRSCLSNEVIERMTVRQIRSFFSHYLLDWYKKELNNCLEKSEMLQLVRNYARELRLSYDVNYTDLWFGAYASSLLDAQRQVLTKNELCSPHGFDTYFKVLEEEVWDESDLAQLIPYEGRPGIMLYQHSVCYFDTNNEFVMEMKEGEMHHPINLQWSWNNDCLVKVGPYPHLVTTRLPDWGWKLENVHVVMLIRDSRAENSRRQ